MDESTSARTDESEPAEELVDSSTEDDSISVSTDELEVAEELVDSSTEDDSISVSTDELEVAEELVDSSTEDDSISVSTDELEVAEELVDSSTEDDSISVSTDELEVAEELVDSSTKDIIGHNKRILTILFEIQKKLDDENWAVSDYIRATVVTNIATNLYKNRASEYEAAETLLEHAKTQTSNASEERDELKNRYKELSESYESLQQEALSVKSLLRKQDIEWARVRADLYCAFQQTNSAEDHLRACEAALAMARIRLDTAESESRRAQSKLDQIENGIAELLENSSKVDRRLCSNANDLMDIVSRRQYCEMTYLAAEQLVRRTQQDKDRLMAERSELEGELEAAEKREIEALSSASTLHEDVRDLIGSSVDEVENEERAKLNLRDAEQRLFRANREHSQQYLNHRLKADKTLHDKREREYSTRSIWIIAMLAPIAVLVVPAVNQDTDLTNNDLIVAFVVLLVGLIAASISRSRWMQRLGEFWRKGDHDRGVRR